MTSRSEMLPGAILALVALATWWVMHGIALANDVGWQFWTARQMLGGARLYADLWEVNPPLWFWSAVPLEWLAERTGAHWGTVLVGTVVALGAFSAWASAQLLAQPQPAERLAVMLLVFAVTVVLPATLTGQREQLALIGALPYAALIARRKAQVAVPPLLAIVVAVLAAYGFALKHYFVAVPLLLEAWLIHGQRGRWRPWRPEVLVLAALAGAYAVAVVVCAPEFFTVMVPMVDTGYAVSRRTLAFTLVKPYVMVWLIAALALWITRRGAVTEATPAAEAAIAALLLTWFGFAVGYVLQSRGWDYHSIAATGAIGTALGLRALRLRGRGSRFLGGAVVAGLILFTYPAATLPAPEAPLLDRVAPGEGVYIADFDAATIFQRGREDLVWVSRSYSSWMVYAIAVAEAEGRSSQALRRLEAQVRGAVSEDLRCNAPQLVLMRLVPGMPGPRSEFSFDEFLRRDPTLRRFLDENYTARVEPIGTVYWRVGPVARAPGLACRTIR